MADSNKKGTTNFNKEELIHSLKRMWLEVERVYRRGEICSERHLQAVMYSALMNDNYFAREFGVYIEPYLAIADEGTYIPDALITKEDKVVAHMEIKYIPHYYPKYEKDFKSFELSQVHEENGTHFQLQVDPATGNWNNLQFTFQDDFLIVYLVIANNYSALFEDNPNFLGTDKISQDRILRLFGEITREGNPAIEFSAK